MESFKEFLRTKGLYVALSVGVVAALGLMVAYNYDNYKKTFEQDKQTIDLNAPEKDDATVTSEKSTEASSQGIVAGNTDAEDVAGVPSEKEKKQEKKQEEKQDENLGVASRDVDEKDKNKDSATDLDERQESLAASTDPVIVDENGVMVAKCYDGENPLVWPVEGEVILPYSMDTTVYFKTLSCYRCNPGMFIAAAEGENVLAAYEGVVESVTEDKEHGGIVTIDMGNGYKAIYGQLMNITVRENDAVTTACNIGEIAPVTSYYAKEGSHLYFELQKDGEPVNPLVYMQ